MAGNFQQTRETERQRDRETERQRDRETERQRDRETETERQRDRQRDRLTNTKSISQGGASQRALAQVIKPTCY